MLSESPNGLHWTDEQGILALGGEVVKVLDKPAENRRAILDAFQAAGWPGWIANPLKPDRFMDNGQRLADAVYHLNQQRKKRIRFHRDGTGTGVRWELVKRRKRGGKRPPGGRRDATCFDGQATDGAPGP